MIKLNNCQKCNCIIKPNEYMYETIKRKNTGLSENIIFHTQLCDNCFRECYSESREKLTRYLDTLIVGYSINRNKTNIENKLLLTSKIEVIELIKRNLRGIFK